MTYEEWLEEYQSAENLRRYDEYCARHKFPVEYRVWFRTIGGFPQY
jgi:hypothetical protein